MKNTSVGKFTLTGIEKAAKGIPKIDVTFDLDENGILFVSALDKKTKKEKKVEIKCVDTKLTDQ